MNTAMKNQILSELEALPDQKISSLLDFLQFLKQDKQEYHPNAETDELQLTSVQKKELDRRLEHYKSNPGTAVSWEHIKSKLNQSSDS